MHPLFASLGGTCVLFAGHCVQFQIRLNSLFFHEFLASFPVDTYENSRGLTVKADLPGVSKDKLKLSYQDRWLTIESERPCEADTTNAFIERPCGVFQRNIRLPAAIKPESISAKLQDGVLTVNMTKEKPGDSVTVRVD